ncbi:unnamed protein product, partial [Closterium sp. Naga37s-1]
MPYRNACLCPALRPGTVPLCPALRPGTVPLCPALRPGTVPLCPALRPGTVPLCPALRPGTYACAPFRLEGERAVQGDGAQGGLPLFVPQPFLGDFIVSRNGLDELTPPTQGNDTAVPLLRKGEHRSPRQGNNMSVPPPLGRLCVPWTLICFSSLLLSISHPLSSFPLLPPPYPRPPTPPTPPTSPTVPLSTPTPSSPTTHSPASCCNQHLLPLSPSSTGYPVPSLLSHCHHCAHRIISPLPAWSACLCPSVSPIHGSLPLPCRSNTVSTLADEPQRLIQHQQQGQQQQGRGVRGEQQGGEVRRAVIEGPGMKSVWKAIKPPKTKGLRTKGLFPTADNVRGRVFQSCAVVGESAALLALPCGAHIDRHEAIFRVGAAAARPWSGFVGSRTSIRVVRPEEQEGAREVKREMVLVAVQSERGMRQYLSYRRRNTTSKHERHHCLSPAFLTYVRSQARHLDRLMGHTHAAAAAAAASAAAVAGGGGKGGGDETGTGAGSSAVGVEKGGGGGGEGGKEEDGLPEASEGWTALMLALNTCRRVLPRSHSPAALFPSTVTVYGWPLSEQQTAAQRGGDTLLLPQSYATRCLVTDHHSPQDRRRLLAVLHTGVATLGMPCALECLQGLASCPQCIGDNL